MKKLAALLVLALASVALVACGGSDNTTTTTTSSGNEAGGGGAAESGKEAGGGESESGSTVKLEADPGGELAYTTTKASAKAGEVTIDFKNPQSLTHDVILESSKGITEGETDQIGQGETSVTLNLRKGTYTYYCSLPGHREAGMEGTLTVK